MTSRDMGRRPWLDDELSIWQDQLEQEETTERWRRVSGISGLSRRQLAILHELWRWRDAQARSRDIPARRVLRDDLMLELARRASDDEQQIRAVRGMDWRKLQRAIPEIAACVTRGLALPDEVCPYAGPVHAAVPQYWSARPVPGDRRQQHGAGRSGRTGTGRVGAGCARSDRTSLRTRAG